VPLRLRILLLVGATNAALLLLLVGLGVLAGPSPAVGEPALREAFRVALDPAFPRSECRYVRFVVRLIAPGEEAEVPEGPPELRERAEAIARDLGARAAGGERGVSYDASGFTAIWDAPGAGATAVHVGFNERARSAAFETQRSAYLVLFPGTVLLAVATYMVLSRTVLRPVERLVRAADRVALGAAPVPVPTSGRGDEMDRLIASFNRMAAEVHDYQRQLEARVLEALSRVKAAESHLVVAQRLAATGTLAAGIAHEINNPLGGIANAVRRLRDGDLAPGKREEYFRIVLEGLDRIAEIVRRVLDFTPRESAPAPLDAAEVCRRAADLARHRAESRAVRLEVRPRGPVRGVVGDAQELQHAVLNLVLNAVDAIPEGRGGTVRVDARREGGEVVMEVSDDGVGMDEETRRRCVDMFYTTKPAGTGHGLGLAMVQHIVTDHGGSLEIESAPGRGTTVRMRIPAAAAA
jgi:signal transduction histidine kinase